MPATQEGLARLVAKEGVSERVVQAFRAVDRADFVPEHARDRAYEDRPIEILEGQTTSQPTLIARMIDELQLLKDSSVLEVGSGFGFQTALLAALAGRVISLDRHPSLVESARRNLERAGVSGTDVRLGDGFEGAVEDAPFDGIVVSAGVPEVPEALAEQLAENGRLVIPLSGVFGEEVVTFVKRGGKLRRVRTVSPARFVPLIRGIGSKGRQ
ncbi:MAG TPA: protein-L-isoaspartate(D-aspartate) O-methyltransferase [Actinomycetota bacterium]|nr:protein-L-isoaspartate(D-aspartate) O-methyltransferase [Actinomycetota bacterium]